MMTRMTDPGVLLRCTGRTINKSARADANLQLVMLMAKIKVERGKDES
jgi:hypothetical protein